MLLSNRYVERYGIFLGLLLLCDVYSGLTQIDRYLYSSEEFRAGALLAFGIVKTETNATLPWPSCPTMLFTPATS